MKLKAIGCLVVLIAVPAALFVLMYFFRPGTCHDYVACDANMQKIWSALQDYAAENDDAYPDRLELLHPNYLDLRRARCPTYRGPRDSYDTGYQLVPDVAPGDGPRKPLLFCKRYHLNGEGPGTYMVQFGILLNGGAIIHVRDDDLGKYDGPMRRYRHFRKFPYDGSMPTLDLVRSVEHRFPDEIRTRDNWINLWEDEAEEE